MIKIILKDNGFVLVNPNDIIVLEFNKQKGNVTIRFVDKPTVIYENVEDVLNASVKVINRH